MRGDAPLFPDAEEIVEEEAAPTREYDPSLLPDEEFFKERPTLSTALSDLKSDIEAMVSIFDVYDHFVGKQRQNHNGRNDGIMMSCPSPTHQDNTPSASARMDGVWFCHSCQAKGDMFTIAGMQLGLECRSKDFTEILTKVADAFGIPYIQSPITKKILQRPSTASRVTITPDEVIIDPPPEAAEDEQVPIIDWEALFPAGTFGRSWMDALKVDDLPEQYYVFEALQAIGLAMGRDTYTPDSQNIFANLYLVLFGGTGIGKSRAIRQLTQLLAAALPYDSTNPHSKGASLLPMPASPEALIDQFSKPIYKDDTEKEIISYGSVRALIPVDEFASLLSKSEQGKGGLKAQLITLYDTHDVIAIHSRGHGTVKAMFPFCSVITSTQPTAIRMALSHNDLISGYMNRHVFALGTPKRRYSMGRPVIDLKEPTSDLMNVRAWAAQGRRITPVADAEKVFDKFFRSVIEKIDYEANPLLARIDLLLRKLMLILAANERSDYITVDIVNRVLALYPYLEFCYREVGSNVVSSVSGDLSDWLTTYCKDFPFKKHKAGPTLRDIRHAMSKRFDNKQLLDALDSIEKIGICLPLEPQKTAAGGRPTKRYVYQPHAEP